MWCALSSCSLAPTFKAPLGAVFTYEVYQSAIYLLLCRAFSIKCKCLEGKVFVLIATTPLSTIHILLHRVLLFSSLNSQGFIRMVCAYCLHFFTCHSLRNLLRSKFHSHLALIHFSWTSPMVLLWSPTGLCIPPPSKHLVLWTSISFLKHLSWASHL